MANPDPTLSDHGDVITAARGCRCDRCAPKRELLEHMRHLRVDEGWTLDELSMEFGWASGTISKYLRLMKEAR